MYGMEGFNVISKQYIFGLLKYITVIFDEYSTTIQQIKNRSLLDPKYCKI